MAGAVYLVTDTNADIHVYPERDLVGNAASVYCSNAPAGLRSVASLVGGDIIGDTAMYGSEYTVASTERVSRYIFVMTNGCRMSVMARDSVCSHSTPIGPLPASSVSVGDMICVMGDHANPATVASIEKIG